MALNTPSNVVIIKPEGSSYDGTSGDFRTTFCSSGPCWGDHGTWWRAFCCPCWTIAEIRSTQEPHIWGSECTCYNCCHACCCFPMFSGAIGTAVAFLDSGVSALCVCWSLTCYKQQYRRLYNMPGVQTECCNSCDCCQCSSTCCCDCLGFLCCYPYALSQMRIESKSKGAAPIRGSIAGSSGSASGQMIQMVATAPVLVVPIRQ